MFGFATVAAITVICFVVAEAVKQTTFKDKWIPVLCGVFGGILGIAGFYLMPTFPAEDIITAIAVGIESGLAATGAHQIYKQQTKAE